MQLRSLQTLAEVATEHNSTLIFPIPIELLEFMRRPGAADDASPFAVPPPAPSAPSPPPQPAVAPVIKAAGAIGTSSAGTDEAEADSTSS